MRTLPVILVFCTGLAGGWLFARQEQPSRGRLTPASAPVAAARSAAPPSPAVVPPAEKKPAPSPVLRRELARERELAAIPLDEFPARIDRLFAAGTLYAEGSALLEEWQRRDPEHYLKWRARPGGTFRIDPGSTALNAIARRDPEAAWRLAGGAFATPANERWGLVRDLFATDPDKAITLAAAHAGELSASQNGGGLVPYDPAAWQPILTKMDPGPVRRRLLREALEHYATRPALNPADSLTWLGSLPPDLQNEARQILRHDPPSLSRPTDREQQNFAAIRQAWGIPKKPGQPY